MPAMNGKITVIKRNLKGEEVWRYQGEVTRQERNAIHLKAHFNGREDDSMGVTIRTGDLFIETYYTDRWYNIFEIHDRDEGELKGWYCNIGKPAVVESEEVLSYVDLALDLWVAKDGTQTVLDEDEFEGMEMDEETRSRARQALAEIQECFKEKQNPGA